MSERILIVNADDFGASPGVNSGIVEAHTRGIVTSTSLMVLCPAASDAARLAGEHPELAVGLHWDLDSEAARRVDLDDPVAVMTELARQLDAFRELMGRPPTHVDSHHHIHREPEIDPIARKLAAPLGVPLRGDGRVNYIGGFYGQWEHGVTDLHHVSVEFLTWILRNEVVAGWTEIGCHPGHLRGDLATTYYSEREVELATLTDPRVRHEIDALGIRLASYADLEPREPILTE